jgi:anti-anti-sigma factor
MIDSDTEVSGTTKVLRLRGEMTIQHAYPLKLILTEPAVDVERFLIDVAGVTDIDLSGLQLLCSMHRTVMQSGKRMEILGRGSETFRKARLESGYLREKGCQSDTCGDCWWIEGGANG